MAVTQESDSNSKKSVEEPTRHCGEEGADPGPCGLVQQHKSNGSCSSTRPKVIRKDKCGTIRSHKLGGKSIGGKSHRLSDIDDIEVDGYLNTKEEMHRKRIFWEAMNEKYIKVKKQKQAADRKKVASVKKATKTTEKMEPEPERRSSRINYDALKSIGGDLQESCELSRTARADSYAQGTQNSPHGSSGHVMHDESNESWSEEDQDQHDFSYAGETDYQYGDEDFYDDVDP